MKRVNAWIGELFLSANIHFICILVSRDPFYQNGLFLIPAWISNHMPSKMWDEVTFPIPNFDGCIIEVLELINDFVPYFRMYFLIHAGINFFHVSKRGINNKCTWSHGHCHHDHRYLWIMQTNRSVWKCNVLFIISKTFKWFLRQTNGILSIFLRPLTVHCRLNKRLSKKSWGWWFETLSRPLWRHRNG